MSAAACDLERLRQAATLSGIATKSVVLPLDQHIVLQEMRFHYVDWGGRAQRTLLFLHGGALHSRVWDLVCLALRDDYRCLALDLRGHGDSEWSKALDYGFLAHAADIAALLDALELSDVVLVGQSLGGMSALLAAARSPSRIAGLVVIDAGPNVRLEGARRIADFVASAGSIKSLDDLVERAARFNPRRNRTLLRYSLLNNLCRLPDGTLSWKYDRRHLSPQAFGQLLEQLSSLASEVQSVKVPTLVLRGAESDVFSDADAESLAASLPHGSWRCIPGAGHNIHGDNAPALVESLRDFLAAHRL